MVFCIRINHKNNIKVFAYDPVKIYVIFVTGLGWKTKRPQVDLSDLLEAELLGSIDHGS